MDDHTDAEGVAPPFDPVPGWLADQNRCEHATLWRATVRGVALLSGGASHGSHACFENVRPGGNKLYRQGTVFERPATRL